MEHSNLPSTDSNTQQPRHNSAAQDAALPVVQPPDFFVPRRLARDTAHLSPQAVLSLQRTIGNRATRNMLRPASGTAVVQRVVDLDQSAAKLMNLETLPVPGSNKQSENTIITKSEYSEAWQALKKSLKDFSELTKGSPAEEITDGLYSILQQAEIIKEAMTPHGDELMSQVYKVRLKPIDDILDKCRDELARLGESVGSHAEPGQLDEIEESEAGPSQFDEVEEGEAESSYFDEFAQGDAGSNLDEFEESDGDPGPSEEYEDGESESEGVEEIGEGGARPDRRAETKGGAAGAKRLTELVNAADSRLAEIIAVSEEWSKLKTSIGYYVEDMVNEAESIHQLINVISEAVTLREMITPHEGALEPLDAILRFLRREQIRISQQWEGDIAPTHSDEIEAGDGDLGQLDEFEDSDSESDELEEVYDTIVTMGMRVGGGIMGSVYEVEGDESNLFKPASKPEQGLAARRAEIHTESGEKRAVATHQIDKLLGTGVTGETKLAQTASGQKGHIMEKAHGKQLGSLSKEERASLYQKPTAKKGLYNLQTLDYVTGELDRHHENIIADPDSGQITGIDNETAFSPNSRRITAKIQKKIRKKLLELAATAKASPYPATSALVNQEEPPQFKDQYYRSSNIGAYAPFHGVWNMGLPDYMDEAVARNIVDNLTANNVAEVIEDLLSPEAVENVKTNFTNLQRHASQLLEEHNNDPTKSKIIPSAPDDSNWDDRVPSTPGENYFYP